MTYLYLTLQGYSGVIQLYRIQLVYYIYIIYTHVYWLDQIIAQYQLEHDNNELEVKIEKKNRRSRFYFSSLFFGAQRLQSVCRGGKGGGRRGAYRMKHVFTTQIRYAIVVVVVVVPCLACLPTTRLPLQCLTPQPQPPFPTPFPVWRTATAHFYSLVPIVFMKLSGQLISNETLP